jgi:hypothetical protein
MQWEPIVAVLIFIGGLAWGRYDGDRRERRASLAAQQVAFEQLQRKTHLELQDALTETYAAADLVRQGRADQRHTVFAPAYNRANVLQTRVADDEVRKLAQDAIRKCQVLAGAPQDGWEEVRKQANNAIVAAQRELGTLVRTPPRV